MLASICEQHVRFVAIWVAKYGSLTEFIFEHVKRPSDTASSRQVVCLSSSVLPMVWKCLKNEVQICSSTPLVLRIASLQSGSQVQAYW